MGILDRLGSSLPGGGPADPDGTALVLASNPVANHDRRVEVRIPGTDPYETEIRARVPVLDGS